MRPFIESVYGLKILFLHEIFDSCIMGYDEITERVAYSIPKCIDTVLITGQLDDEDEAKIYFYKNVWCADYLFLNQPDHGNYAWHYN